MYKFCRISEKSKHSKIANGNASFLEFDINYLVETELNVQSPQTYL
jgi:hypothetical protein